MPTERETATFQAQSRWGNSLWAQSMQRLLRKKVGMVCLVVIAVLYLWGLLATWTTPYSFRDQDLTIVKQGPSFSHPLGTDQLGRDMLTRVVYGLRTTVIITVISLVTGSLLLGIGLGLVSGYFGKMVDAVIMRGGEVCLAFPGILLVILIAATARPRVVDWVRGWGGDELIRLGVADYVVVSVALLPFSWVAMARLVRGQVFQVKENQYVEAAQATGASTGRILLIHILPNVIGPVIVVVSMGMGAAVGAEIILSWLGIGIQPPTPSLGVMIWNVSNIGYLRTDPHLLLFPVGVVTVLIFAFNLLGDALNDAFNPRTR